jgi:cell division septum initiation protein DivIVA
MTKEEIENYFVESAGYGRDKVRNFMDIVNKALEQKGERITELDKENAELKKQLEMSNKVYNDNLDYSHHIEGQLTKAKEHIENLLYYVKQCSCERSNYAELEHDIAEAEQFLKDSEVEK